MNIVTTKKFTDPNYLPKLPGALGRSLYQGIIDELVSLVNDGVTSELAAIAVVSGNDTSRVMKYANGQMEIDMIVTFGSTPATISWGNLYVTANLTLGNFPVAFISTPIVGVFCNGGAGIATMDNPPTATTLPIITVARPTSDTYTTLTIHVIAKGRWK